MLTLLCPLSSAQEIKLLPGDGAAHQHFGCSVAISGDTIICGAYGDSANGFFSGAAYLFDVSTGSELFKLLPSDGAQGDDFGKSVAIGGGFAIVGAYYNDDVGWDSGSAYIFDISTGAQVAKLLPSEVSSGDYFGYCVATSSGTALVGSVWDDANGYNSGSAYLFDASTGTQLAKLLPTDGASGHEFGVSVAISGTTAVVGASGDSVNGTNSGSAYLFDTTTGDQTAKLIPIDGAPHDYFGSSVAINGDTVIIGAPRDNDNGADSGSAYLFDAATGAQTAKLLAVDGRAGDLFGWSVDVSGSSAFVGAPLGDGGDAQEIGAAYLFDTATAAQNGKHLASDGASEDWFGDSVAISGDDLVVGAGNRDESGTNSGSAYLIERCVGQVESYCVASPNSVSASGALIHLEGSSSVSTNVMTLRVDSLPANQFGVFFCGPLKEDPPTPFGDGFRCVGTSGLARLNPPVSTHAGTAQRTLDFSSSPLNNTQAGDTLHFQLWYRDPAAGGSNYNLTDALEVTFCP